MYYLQQKGYHVIGVELSDEATDDFFIENNLTMKKEQQGYFVMKTAQVECGSIKLICGDLLKLQATDLQGVDLVYDRAGYNSVPSFIRRDYAQLITSCLPSGTKMLMGLLDLESTEIDSGPPYYISDDELKIFKNKFDLTIEKENRSEFFIKIE